MAQEDKPDLGSKPDAPSEKPQQDQARPANPSSLSADAEKDAQVEAAKARVAAAKEQAQKAATPGPPKAPVKKKEEGPKPVDAASHPLVKKLREKFDGAVIEASEFLGQLSIRIEPVHIVEVCEALSSDGDAPFNYLSDLTCVHYPDRKEAPFEVVYNLYSIPANERVRLQVAVNGEGVASVTGVGPAAGLAEGAGYDLFGLKFRNHPELRRIRFPPDLE